MSAEFTRIPNTELVELSAEDRVEVDKLIEKIEDDEDVQNVYTNLKPAEE